MIYNLGYYFQTRFNPHGWVFGWGSVSRQNGSGTFWLLWKGGMNAIPISGGLKYEKFVPFVFREPATETGFGYQMDGVD
jgi:hypothetical protein